jgi:predicted nuclease with RNAse H fold
VVGAREWFGGKLSWLGATASDPDSDELCDLTTVSSIDAPMVIAKLNGRGIRAAEVDAFTVAHGIGSSRIQVRRRDLDAARAMIASDESDEPDRSE